MVAEGLGLAEAEPSVPAESGADGFAEEPADPDGFMEALALGSVEGWADIVAEGVMVAEADGEAVGLLLLHPANTAIVPITIAKTNTKRIVFFKVKSLSFFGYCGLPLRFLYSYIQYFLICFFNF